jgi:hypothetical protein
MGRELGYQGNAPHKQLFKALFSERKKNPPAGGLESVVRSRAPMCVRARLLQEVLQLQKSQLHADDCAQASPAPFAAGGVLQRSTACNLSTKPAPSFRVID